MTPEKRCGKRSGARAGWWLVALAVLAIGGCRSDGGLSGAPASISPLLGASQFAPVGTDVTTAPSVRVRDSDGMNLAGIMVHFTIVSGGGTVAGDSARTDAAGIATVGRWTLGTAPGNNRLKAAVDGTSLVTTFDAIAVTGNGIAIRASGPQGFLALVGGNVGPEPAVLVIDPYANPVAGVTVNFTVGFGGGSAAGTTVVTDAQGIARVGRWTVGVNPGTYTLKAQIDDGGAALTFTAQALSAEPVISAASPQTQAGYLNFPVTILPRVQVSDALGHPLAGISVTFATVGGDATITGGTAVTDNNGVAAPADWRMGSQLSTSIVSAVVPIASHSVTFTATGTPAPFLIDLRFLTPMVPDQRDAFVAAARRWMGIITAHLAPAPVMNLPAGTCTTHQPFMNETITDVVIFAEATPIDGVNNILGSASPCLSRSGSDLTVVGTMQFDSADLEALGATGRLVATIAHEMGHVLGFGTTWASRGVVSGLGTVDPRFTGPETASIWPPFGAVLGFPGLTPPVENSGGSGTEGSHWRESVFDAELMTGYIEDANVPMPISRLTIAAMKDIGYQVSYATADPFAGNLRSGARSLSAGTPINEQIGRARWQITATGERRPIP